MTRLAVLLSTFFYVGYAPFAPGTAGAAAGLALYALVAWTGSPVVESLVIVVVFVAGAWAGTIAERHFGGVDPGPIVIDEVLGMLITLAFIPVGWSGVFTGFFLFRLFDVIKPWPASRFERLHGGLGVMADDAMAAVYANLALRAARWAAPGLVV